MNDEVEVTLDDIESDDTGLADVVRLEEVTLDDMESDDTGIADVRLAEVRDEDMKSFRTEPKDVEDWGLELVVAVISEALEVVEEDILIDVSVEEKLENLVVLVVCQ